jgi:hypothetical protein
MPEPEPEPEAEEPYEGPSSSGIPPAIDPDDYDFDAGVVLVDAGSVVVDTRCCVTRFSISDQEPADATGVIEGDLPVFAGGTPLTREDGGWTATVCHPLNASGYYWYRFVWDGGLFDGGTETQPDGGEAPVLIPVTATSVRASDRETSVTNSQGTRNFYREVSSCDGLGGRVP